ncbi:MAG: hypothetical protein KME15_16540 [Drouetiella hepatica Uher 2000/2452]|jgi:hypothetical protein|uniref:Pycsar effector protein domain-containing protein n=1 Tax=Drouetiella hepatica Uher 2000/2452 TaxID=904376 RepID=A0A951QEF1_9CYAN|nr:hypothetical protein [Drouetiella hepatica Uher 2000/2452]
MSSKLEYSRRLYDDVLDWYKSADSKAQVVLAIDAAFLAFLTSTVFSEPDKLRSILDVFSWVTWLNLALMLLSLIVSIGAAISCVWSRIYSIREVKQIIKKAESRCQDSDKYPPEMIMWFFQFIEALDQKKFQVTLESSEEEFELKVLAEEIYVLSSNVRKKHIAVNIGFGFAALSLIFFVMAAVSYLYSAA